MNEEQLEAFVDRINDLRYAKALPPITLKPQCADQETSEQRKRDEEKIQNDNCG